MHFAMVCRFQGNKYKDCTENKPTFAYDNSEEKFSLI